MKAHYLASIYAPQTYEKDYRTANEASIPNQLKRQLSRHAPDATYLYIYLIVKLSCIVQKHIKQFTLL